MEKVRCNNCNGKPATFQSKKTVTQKDGSTALRVCTTMCDVCVKMLRKAGVNMKADR